MIEKLIQLIKDKYAWYIIIIIVLTVFMKGFGDQLFSNYMNERHPSIFTYQYKMNFTASLLLLIPASIVAIPILFVMSKFEDKVAPSPHFEKLWGGINWTFSAILKIILWIGKLLLKLAGILTLGLFSLLHDKSNSRPVRTRRSYSEGGISGGGGFSDSDARRNQEALKKEAMFQASRKQKEADYATKHALKQARYNINTTHYTNRAHRANQLQREADEARKRARNL